MNLKSWSSSRGWNNFDSLGVSIGNDFLNSITYYDTRFNDVSNYI